MAHRPRWLRPRWRTAAALAVLLPFLSLNGRNAPTEAATRQLVVIFMENHSRTSIERSADADYLKRFEAGGTSFTQYYGVTHPSLPNYLAFASGSTDGKTGADGIRPGAITEANIWSQLQGANISWGVYQESMPSVCSSAVTSGEYALKHNPATPFYNVFSKPRMCNKVVPYTSFDVNNLPALSFITPNLCNDMHDCSIATGDNWLQARVPAMLAAGAEVVITFDEGSHSTSGGGNIYTALDGPGIGSSANGTTYNHYSLLAAIEDRYGLPRLNGAGNVQALPLA